MDKAAYKDMWVHVEHDGKSIMPVSLELCCAARGLCDRSGDALAAVVAGELEASELEKLLDCGVDKLIRVTGLGYERYSTQAYSNLYVELCKKYRPSAVLVGATVNVRDFAPHFAARLETGCTSDATELVYNAETGDIEFIEPAAGGKIMAVITIPSLRPQVGTIRPGTFKYAPGGRREFVDIINEEISTPPEDIRTKLLSYVADENDPDMDISSAEKIVCVGDGVKDESMPKYRELAGLLGAKMGGTRPVIDRELLPYKLQIGQSGVMVKPRLYICFGVSGAVNHVTGVDAELFIAVNRDASAPIFNYCDYGIVGDMDEVCDAMLAAIRNKTA